MISRHKGCQLLVIEPVHRRSNSIMKVRFLGTPCTLKNYLIRKYALFAQLGTLWDTYVQSRLTKSMCSLHFFNFFPSHSTSLEKGAVWEYVRTVGSSGHLASTYLHLEPRLLLRLTMSLGAGNSKTFTKTCTSHNAFEENLEKHAIKR